MSQLSKQSVGGGDVLKLTISVLAVLLMSFVFYYLGNMPNEPDSDTLEVGLDGFEPIYLNQTQNIEIPGEFPIGLVSGEGIELLDSSHLINKEDGIEEYLFSVRLKDKSPEDLMDKFIKEMESFGYDVEVAFKSPFIVVLDGRDLSRSIHHESVQKPDATYVSLTYRYVLSQ